MKRLPERFSLDGFDFRQLLRSGDVVLFEKSKPKAARPCFEVCIVERRPEEEFQGRNYPAREAIPPPQLWGHTAWTFSDFGRARAKFGELVRDQLKQKEIA
jgi:hypothetical protein